MKWQIVFWWVYDISALVFIGWLLRKGYRSVIVDYLDLGRVSKYEK